MSHLEYAVRCPNGHVGKPTDSLEQAAASRVWADQTAWTIPNGHGCRHNAPHTIVFRRVHEWQLIDKTGTEGVA